MRRATLVVALGAVIFLAAVPNALAATFTVTTTSFASTGGCDVASCNLIEAIQATNGSPGPDTIQIPSGLYQPPGGLPTLTDVTVVAKAAPARGSMAPWPAT